MKKKISFLLVAALLLATLIPALPILAADETTGGETVANTFNADDANPTISTKEDYINFFKAAFCAGGKDFTGKTVTLLNDITFNDTAAEGWYTQAGVTKLEPTANNNAAWISFGGTFDGGNHTLQGVIVEGRFGYGSVGIFPFLGSGATIKNLNVDGFYVCGTNSRLSAQNGLTGINAIGGLVGCAMDSVTLDGCMVKNGILTATQNEWGMMGALMGSLKLSAKDEIKITNTTVSDVQFIKGESKCEKFGEIWGNLIVAGNAVSDTWIDFSGSYFVPVSQDLQPVGISVFESGGQSAKIYFKNTANGISAAADDSSRTFGHSNTKTFTDGTSYFDNTEKANSIFDVIGCYGEIPTVKLLGVQNSTTGNGIRFVGLIKKSAIEAGTVAALGFEISAGGKSADVECTKVYESILEDGKTLTAPEGYYFFTFVVTDVTEGTEFAVNAVAAVSEKECSTTEGVYTYPHTVS